MRVKITGLGIVDFPDDMSEEEIHAQLQRFKSSSGPVVVTETKTVNVPEIIREPQVVEIEKVVTVYEPKVVEVDRIIEKKIMPRRWHFRAEKDDMGDWDIYAEPEQ